MPRARALTSKETRLRRRFVERAKSGAGVGDFTWLEGFRAAAALAIQCPSGQRATQDRAGGA
jgi:hypothetical protein